MTSLSVIAATFVFIILLPWLGGLFLVAMYTLVSFWYINHLMKVAMSLRRENTRLRDVVSKSDDEISKLNLRLQAVMIENASLGARRDE